MTECAVKRGFFNLRDCGSLASSICGSCSRPICQEHSTLHSGAQICLDCSARQTQDTDIQPGSDSSWTYNARHSYYSTHAYSPGYRGSSYDHYYDEYDVRSFDREEAEPSFQDEQSDAGLFDS